MDRLSTYYIQKKNLRVKDSFHERIDPNDINTLQKAFIMMAVAPLGSLAFLTFLKSIYFYGG